jgi:hypothetical protein
METVYFSNFKLYHFIFLSFQKKKKKKIGTKCRQILVKTEMRGSVGGGGAAKNRFPGVAENITVAQCNASPLLIFVHVLNFTESRTPSLSCGCLCSVFPYGE